MSTSKHRGRTRTALYVALLGALIASVPVLHLWAEPDQGGTADAAYQPLAAATDLRTAALGDGEKVYMSVCASCHQANGQGIQGVFPPLAGTEWVLDDKGRLIRIVLHGLMGETEVQGTVYSGAMPPWGGSMSDKDIAEVLTFIRTSWGNEASAVTADEVAKVRAATEGRTQPWTEDELKKEENQGIPGMETSSTDSEGAP